MTYTNLRDSVAKMRRYEKFCGNTFHSTFDGTDIYMVFSYGTIIFAKNIRNGRCFFNYTKYSRTTTKHQYYVIQAYADTDLVNMRFNVGKKVIRKRFTSGTDNAWRTPDLDYLYRE